jgi:recombinational DNA repair ATPase RecF
VYVARLEVEGGFLDALDLRFEPGLNVLIGPRGAGKTSVIELLRYSFEVPGYTKESDREARKHALSVLRDGRVTVTIDIDGEIVILTRSAEEERARRSPPILFDRPTVLSQKEIELIGRDAGGRLRLSMSSDRVLSSFIRMR